jgi:DNA repair protein RecO (recombination protein O)
MPLAGDRCICLRKHEFSETSQILTLMTRNHGLLKLMAKGAHRRTKAGSSKFDGGVDLLDFGDAVFTDDSSRDLATLTEWKLLEGNLGLRKSLRGIYLALYSTEMVTLLFEEHDAHPEVFDRLAKDIPALATPRREETFLDLELFLLRSAGFMPELNLCVSCGNELRQRGPGAFSPTRGGMLCPNCAPAEPDRMPIDSRLLRLLASLPAASENAARLPQLTRHQTDPLNALLAEHLQYALGRRPRMTRYVVSRRFTGSGAPAQPAGGGQ